MTIIWRLGEPRLPNRDLGGLKQRPPLAGDHLAGRPSPVDIEALALEREPPKAGDPAHDAGAQRDPAVVRQNAINSRPDAIEEFGAEDANIAAPQARRQMAPVGSLRLFDDLELGVA